MATSDDQTIDGYIALVAAIYRWALIDAIAPHNREELREHAWAFLYAFHWQLRVPEVEALAVAHFARIGEEERAATMSVRTVPEELRDIRDEATLETQLDIVLAGRGYNISVYGRDVQFLREYRGDTDVAILGTIEELERLTGLEVWEAQALEGERLRLIATWRK